MTTRCKVAARCLTPVRRFTVFHVEMLFRNGHLSYWGVSAVAETTRVDPGVFDSMCGHVHLQACCIYVSFIAVGALVGLVLVVLAPMGLWKMVIEGKKCKKCHGTVKCSVVKVITYVDMYCFCRITKFFHTCKFESCVKDFSQPGWVHLYGRSPVWILHKNTSEHIHVRTHALLSLSCWSYLTWPDADEKPKLCASLTCCVAGGDWAVWNTYCSRSRCRVSLQCGSAHVGQGS